MASLVCHDAATVRKIWKHPAEGHPEDPVGGHADAWRNQPFCDPFDWPPTAFGSHHRSRGVESRRKGSVQPQSFPVGFFRFAARHGLGGDRPCKWFPRQRFFRVWRVFNLRNRKLYVWRLRFFSPFHFSRISERCRHVSQQALHHGILFLECRNIWDSVCRSVDGKVDRGEQRVLPTNTDFELNGFNERDSGKVRTARKPVSFTVLKWVF
jgi:hypothetical protein